MRQKRNEKKIEEEKNRSETNDWLKESFKKKKTGRKLSLKNPRKPHRRRDERRKKRRDQQGRGSSAVRQVLKPPVPPSLSLPNHLPPSHTPLPGRGGVDMGARDGVETRRNTAHTDGGWATDLACSPYGTPVEVSRVHLTKDRRKNNSLLNRHKFYRVIGCLYANRMARHHWRDKDDQLEENTASVCLCFLSV